MLTAPSRARGRTYDGSAGWAGANREKRKGSSPSGDSLRDKPVPPDQPRMRCKHD